MSIALEIQRIRKEFPILHQKVRGASLVYLDNAATTQKPQAVIASISAYYEQYNSNVHRGAHYLANLATDTMEKSRDTVQHFIGASHREEVIFTQGTTDGINLVAHAWAMTQLKSGDEILVALSEHHANIVPWQQVCKKTGAILKVIPLNQDGTWVSDWKLHVNGSTKLVSVGWVSNATGVVHPIQEMITHAHSLGAKVLIDAAQAVTHFPLQVAQLNCDWLVFSGHKLFGPTGIGVLFGKKEILEVMEVYRTGGEMIKKVSFEGTTFQEAPLKFEAGTPHIQGIIGLGEAVRWFTNMGWELIHRIEQAQIEWMKGVTSAVREVQWIGESERKTALYSFWSPQFHHADLGELLDQQGVAIRTGHHCTQPLWEAWKMSGTARASFALYNNEEDAVQLQKSLVKSIQLLIG
jgi:cysteine desulfurase/selenocysteine lyase